MSGCVGYRLRSTTQLVGISAVVFDLPVGAGAILVSHRYRDNKSRGAPYVYKLPSTKATVVDFSLIVYCSILMRYALDE